MVSFKVNMTNAKDPRFFLLQTTPTEEDKVIKGSRLPTVRQVLLCFLAHHKTSCKREAANKTVDIVKHIYDCARIPTLFKNKMAEEVVNLFDNMKKILKIQPKCRTSGTGKEQVDSFKRQLETTMKFWPRDVMERIKTEDDKMFLLSMMTDRKASMAGIDKKSSETEAKIRKRAEQELKRIEIEKERKMKDSCLSTSVIDTDEEEEAIDDPVPLYTCAGRSHKRRVKTGVTVFIPPNILKAPTVVQSLVRNKISSAAISDVMHDIVTSVEGDPSRLSLSYATTQRYRVETVHSISEKIKENWTPPPVANIHWDGKLMDTLDGGSKEERLPVLLSGAGGTKLLGVPSIPHKSTEKAGVLITEASYELIKEWDCEDCLSGMVFDTTSSNTGCKTAACVTLQMKLNRPLLWYACRHHVGEIVLTHVWDSLRIEASNSPEINLFKRFKENFTAITVHLKEDLDFPDPPPALLERKSDITALCQDYLKQRFSRGDYKELATLVLLYLSDGNDTVGMPFNRPGALHKARWMAKLLYTIKMDLMGSIILKDLPKGAIFASQQLPKLRRFVQFVVFCYISWWLTAPVASTAPKNDQLMINSFINYKDVDSVIAEAALQSFGNHMWYLTEELVPLALFSDAVDASIKQSMVSKMLDHKQEGLCQKRHGTGFGKPTFPKMPTEVSQDLSTYVGPDSWSFFKLLKLDDGFLYKPVEDWHSDEQYNMARLTVNSISVVNDAAERGVKLGHDCLGSALKEDRYQKILQVVENCRNKLPNSRKRRLSSSSWYLTL